MRRGAALALVLAVSLIGLPALADAKKRPGAPRARTVSAAIVKVQRATPFASGRSAARRARVAFAKRRYCKASDALAAHHKFVARRVKQARKRKARRTVTKLLLLDGRGAKARALVLRSLPAGKACGGKPSVGVDRSLKPQDDLPGKRPVARVEDAYGNGVDFAANELIVQGTDAEVTALVKRWNGKILSEVDFARIGGKGKQFLVRISVAKADQSRLADDIDKLTKATGGSLTVSSEQGLGLLAAAGQEARRGTDVGVNIVQQGSTIATGTSLEANDGAEGFSLVPGISYTSNAFQWTNMSATSTQGVGTAEAWQLIKRSGRDANKVGLAVLDMGFATGTNGPDFGSPVNAISNVPFVSALNSSSLGSCGGGSSCPWHGTNVANTAFAVPDNGLGVAGTGGLVADRIVVYTYYDFFTSIAAVIEAGAAGADVVNMSYGADVPAVLSWTVLPFEAATGIARAAGMNLFAAAGNSNTNVDAEDCFIVCWEETLWTPCENLGVFCVGALAHNATGRASYSNYGKSGGGVDLFAPGTVLVGIDPATGTAHGSPGVHAVNGTSFASPYLAGVAALIRAANPSMSAAGVESLLLSTAKTSSDSKVRKYVNAFAAVDRALPALVNIEAPQNGDTIQRGGNITLKAFAHNADPATIQWTANGNVLGTGAEISTSALPYGDVTIRATAGSLGDTVHITVGNTAPTVQVTQPGDGATFVQNETAHFAGLSGDINQPESDYRLRDGQVNWYRDGASTPFGSGHSTSLDMSTVPVGTHTITMRGTDDAGVSTDASITITVAPPAANPPPSVTITSPANGASANACCQEPAPDNRYYANFNFQADASDPNGDPLTFTWEETVVNPTDPAPDTPMTRFNVEDPGTQKVYWTSCNEQGHDFKLTVSDGTNTRSATVRIYVSVVC